MIDANFKIVAVSVITSVGIRPKGTIVGLLLRGFLKYLNLKYGLTEWSADVHVYLSGSLYPVVFIEILL